MGNDLKTNCSNKELQAKVSQLEKEIKKYKKQINQFNNDLKKVQKLSRIGIWHLDIATNEVEWSEELYIIYGFEPGMPVPPYTEHMKLFTKDSWELLSKSVAKTIKTGIPFELELNTVKHDGSNGWMWVRGEVINDKEGKTTGLWGAARDITDIKNIELQLKESEGKLRNIVEYSPLGILLYELDDKNNLILKDFNRAAENILGVKLDKKIGCTIEKAFPGLKDTTIPDAYREVALTGEEFNDNHIDYDHGEIKGAYDVTTYRVFENNIVVKFYDITERLKYELEISEGRKKFKSLFDNIEEGVALHKMIFNKKNEPIDFIWVDVNPKYEEITQLKKEDLIGKKGKEVIPNIEQKWYDLYGKVTLTGESISTIDHSEYLDKYWEVKAFRPEEGHFAVAMTDVTEKEKTRLEIEKNQYYLAKAQEIGSIGTWELDIKNNVLIWTRENYKIFGVEYGTPLTYDIFLNCIHPDDREFVHNQWSLAMEGVPYDIEHRLLVDGKVVWVREKADVKFDKNKKAISAIGFTQEITRFKETEQNLKESERKFRILADNTNDWEYWMDENEKYVFISPSCEKITGYAIEEFYKYPDLFMELVIDEYKEEVHNHYHSDDRTGPVYTSEFPIKNKQGEIIWIEHSCIPIFDDNGKFLGRRGNNRDITNRKIAEKKLSESRDRFELAMKASKDGLFDWNLITNEIYYSPGWKKMLGYEENELPNDFSIWENLTEAEDVKASWELQQKLINKEVDRFELEFKMKHKDGHWVDILSRAEAIFNKDDKAIRIVGTHTDITQNKKNQKRIIESELRYKTLFDNLNQGVFTQDSDYKIIDVNPAALEIFGTTREHFMGQVFYDPQWEMLDENLIPLKPEERPGIIALQTGKVVKNSLVAVRNLATNHFRWVRINAIPQFSGSSKNASHVFVSLNDITEQKISSDALQSLAGEFSILSGQKFFENVCKYLTTILNVDIAIVGKAINDNKSIKVIAGIENDEVMSSFEYELEGTPCQNVSDGKVCFYPSNVQKLFPYDLLLEEMKIESYTGIPIKDKSGKAIGILVLLSRKKLFEKELYTNVLHIFSSRIALEVDRLQFESELIEAKNIAVQNELKFKALYDYSPDMYVSVSPDTSEIILCNETFLKMTGYERDEIVGKHILEVYHNDSRIKAKEAFDEFRKTGSLNNKELILAKKDGSKLHVSLNVTSIKDKNGKILYSMSSWRDISERVKLRELQLRDRQLLDETGRLAKIGGWELDVKTMDSYYSRETMRIYGYPLDNDPPSGIEGIKHYPPKARKKLQKLVNNALSKGESYDIEVPFINNQGDNLWVRTIGIVEKKGNEVVRLYGTLQDITEQKEAENKIIKAKELAEENQNKIKLNESRLSALVELSQMSNVETKVILDYILNKAIELTQSKIGFLGFVNEDETEVKIHRWSDTAMKECKVEGFDMNFIVEESGIWGDVIRKRRPLIINDYTKPIKSKKGTPVGHVEIKNYLSIPTFRDDKIIAIISVSNKDTKYTNTDVNQLHLLVDGLRKFLEERQEKEELIEARRMAEESDRLKTAFLANMSHEIRTPMNGIVGFTQLLQNPNLTETSHNEYVNIIQRSSERLLNTVNDIIEISKIESGIVTVTKTDIEIGQHVKNLGTFFEPECQKKGLDLIVENENTENVVLHTDQIKLDSIITNLIKNAIKYTDKGYIKTGVKLTEDGVLYYCEDSGIGVPISRQEAIFNRFEQADIEDKKAYQGSGLGLSIVKSFVELLDGKIWLESEEDKGSVFNVLLPYKPVVKEESKLLTDNKTIELRNKNLVTLIVEDDEISAMHLSIISKELFESTIIADNGIDAIDIIKNNPNIDLILMDIKMPKMDGFEATRRIREFDNNVIIIAQTAFAYDTDKENAIESGCNGFISKPIKKELLVDIINQFFQ